MARKEDSKPTKSTSPRDARAYQAGARYRAYPFLRCAAHYPTASCCQWRTRPSLTHFGTNSAVSFLTPALFKPSKISPYLLARHLEAASSYLEQSGHLEAASSYLERPGHLERRGRLELSRATRLSQAASSYLERPRCLEPPRVVMLSSYPVSPLTMTRSAQDDSVRYETSHVSRHCKAPI